MLRALNWLVSGSTPRAGHLLTACSRRRYPGGMVAVLVELVARWWYPWRGVVLAELVQVGMVMWWCARVAGVVLCRSTLEWICA